MAAAATAAELGTDDRNDLDALAAQQRAGVGAAVLGEHHPRLEGHQIVAAVPLLLLGGVAVAAGLVRPLPARSSQPARRDRSVLP